ncbi:putative phloem protein [Helianthus annuus]|uniref:Phloem protein n=1 Tax=Helianthus annuus TaxID=4232 RepID=A0A9K3I142_HELAN|nr:putative phloem protein [Helianthus annuus]KAJ0531391.1 putative phloem protein [Helianthus annuus]KAJ0629267.1 putative phloem protein [Helianthus annuus]KAJ0698234.1 putative phloem protein [Helianthus annuus]KAJ0881308.1 putative phloem protein [Helianthus annuus]
MEGLPADCIIDILSQGSPRDACRSAVVASVFRAAAESDVLWDRFLPPDHEEIISESVSPLKYKSKKELFFKLSSPLFIDHGLKAFFIDKATGKKCYKLSARKLYIAWSANPLFWCWKPVIESRYNVREKKTMDTCFLWFHISIPKIGYVSDISLNRFAEVVELRMTSWLEIEGKIDTRILSPNTMYRAYLIVKVAHHRAYGLDVVPCEVLVEVGEFCSRGTVTLSHNACVKQSLERVCGENKVEEGSRSKFEDNVARVGLERKDGWLEIELGEFYNQGMCEKEVKMSLREINGVHLKGGLVVESLEIRPT